MTYEDYEEHEWQEGEDLIVDNKACIFVEHDEVYGNVVVGFKDPINKPTKSMFEPNVKIYSTSVSIENVEFNTRQ